MSQESLQRVRPTLHIADKNQIPAAEPERQYYFMDIAKEWPKTAFRGKRGSPWRHVSTFGCPIVWVKQFCNLLNQMILWNSKITVESRSKEVCAGFLKNWQYINSMFVDKLIEKEI